jgi:hypothetical protein
VRHDEAVVQRDQRVVGRERLRVGDVQGGGPDRALAQDAQMLARVAQSSNYMSLAMNPAYQRALETGALQKAMVTGAFGTGARVVD